MEQSPFRQPLPAMLTQEPLRYREHLLSNLAGKVLSLLTVWVNPKSLGYVTAEMSLLMVP